MMSGIEVRKFDEAFGEGLKITVKQSQKTESCGEHDGSFYSFEQRNGVNAPGDVLL
jgi:hypothetical protein